MGGVIDKHLHVIECVRDAVEHPDPIGLATPGLPEVLSGRRPAHGGAKLQVSSVMNRLGHRATGPASRARYANDCRHAETVPIPRSAPAHGSAAS